MMRRISMTARDELVAAVADRYARGDRGERGRILDEFAAVTVLGAYLSTNGPGSSTNSPASAMGGVYDIPAVFMAVRGVLTNTLPIDAYRGAGKPEANYLIERLVDCAARRLALDPVALRRRPVGREFGECRFMTEASMADYDIIIRGGTVVDGTRTPR
jgi:CO/xanthine dehydrogenase Mo-binding subunit